MEAENFEWHDGILQEICILGTGRVKVVCDLYPDQSATSRVHLSFLCTEVKSAANLIDFTALLNNKWAGNINDGRIETRPDGHTTLKLFLSDGYLEIITAEMCIEHNPTN
jgi:hypothetical protein